MKIWKIGLPLLAVAGGAVLFFVFWGGAPPGVATVKGHMTSDQLKLGDPVVNTVGMVLVPIPAGEFQMGTLKPKKKKARFEKSEAPQHLVKITKPFYLSAFEVTQEQYEKVMGERPWEDKPLVQEGPHYAASYVSWKNAVKFCEKLSAQENQKYRLPTEAEWEYACRAGTKTAFSFGKDGKQLGEYAWFDKNAYKDGEQYAHPVGQKQPNPWALYDMHGNVWEWCQDKYGKYNGQRKTAVDPKGPKKGRHRVWRGGGFADNPINVRSATRLSFGRADYRPEFAAGFRVVRSFDTKD